MEGLLAGLNPQPVAPRNEVPRLLCATQRDEPRSDELDEGSLAQTVVDLDLHGQAVGEQARAIAQRLGLTGPLAETVERAGRLHDVGKADRRFQLWLHPEPTLDGSRVAKSNLPRHRWNAARAAAGWPRGGRHEALSARLVHQWLKQCPDSPDPSMKDLLLHLVVSHHGSGRPLVRPVADGTGGLVSGVVEYDVVVASADLSLVDWQQPARFRQLSTRFGPWGLALLEAIVRQADHAVSAGADVGRFEVH